MDKHTLEPAGHGGAHSVEEARKHMRTYAIIGVALMVGTALTVWAAFINFGSREINIVAALVIASTRASWWPVFSCTSFPRRKWSIWFSAAPFSLRRR